MGLRDGSDSEYDSEANFRHGGCKRHETITLANIGVSLGYEFFDDIERAVRLNSPILIR